MEIDGADSQDNVNCFRNCPLDFLTSHCKRPQKPVSNAKRNPSK